jgi:hypothetical protein
MDPVVSELLGELVLAGVFDEDIDAGVFEAGHECGGEVAWRDECDGSSLLRRTTS